MTVIDVDFLRRSFRATGQERRTQVSLLAEELYDGAALPRVAQELECGTCGYVTESGNIDQRDAEHLAHDGAHEPGWYGDDLHGGSMLVRGDVDLLNLLTRRAMRDYPDPTPVHVLSATAIDTPDGQCWLTMCMEAQYAHKERPDEYVIGNYASTHHVETFVTCQGCRTATLAARQTVR